MVWKTFLVMYFGTNGVNPSEIVHRIEKLGFATQFGPYDFVFDWKNKEPSKSEVLALGDKVCTALKDSGAVFNLDTHD